MIYAVTGHRPDKLGGYELGAQVALVDFACKMIWQLNPGLVITGMAQGWDLAVAEACARCRIPYHAYVPFIGQEQTWPGDAQLRYQKLVESAAKVVIVNEGGYAVWKLFKRNEAMVDACEHLLALWNGSEGGTEGCVRYAIKVKRPWSNIWKDWMSYSWVQANGQPKRSGTGC